MINEKDKLNQVDKNLLDKVLDKDIEKSEVYNIRKNGKSVERKTNENIDIVTKKDGSGIDIIVKENTAFGVVDIPVIITETGMKDVVYNDFYIGKNANVTIVAGCGIHNCGADVSQHDGIHRFYLEEGAKVKYIEKHYGNGDGKGAKILNPVTELYMKKDSSLQMDTVQVKGVDSALRTTKAELEDGANLVITEKIMTEKKQIAHTDFFVNLKGTDSKTHVVSRSIATDYSVQEFKSNIVGEGKCYGHVECDAIIMDHGQVNAIPQINAKSVDAQLIHEAQIGKIAGEQLIKLMSLGLSEKEAEKAIINGFLS